MHDLPNTALLNFSSLGLLFPYTPLVLQLIETFTNFPPFPAAWLLQVLLPLLAGMLIASSLPTAVLPILQHNSYTISFMKPFSPWSLTFQPEGAFPSGHPQHLVYTFLMELLSLPCIGHQVFLLPSLFHSVLSALTHPKYVFAHGSSSSMGNQFSHPPFSLSTLSSDINKQSGGVRVGNECQEEEDSVSICILVWTMRSKGTLGCVCGMWWA